MANWSVVKDKTGNFRVKNLSTGKISKNKFKIKKNADIQLRNRLRFEKLVKK